MILIIDPKSGKIDYYPTLKLACRWNKWMSYHYLTTIKLTDKLRVYKKMWIYRIVHSYN